MIRQRLIPVILLKDGLLTRSQLFNTHQAIGDPIPTLRRLSNWKVDEIFFINISKNKNFDSRRSDKAHNINSSSLEGIIQSASKFIFAPLAVGGGIKNISEMISLYKSGADKCILNQSLFHKPLLVEEAVKKFGSQAVVASLDFKAINNKLVCYTEGGYKNTGLNFREAIKYACELGVGEIILNCIDHDGSKYGYHREFLSFDYKQFDLPITIMGGATETKHFKEGLGSSGISGVAASNIFYFTENSYPKIKQELIKQNCFLRKFSLSESFLSREPVYKKEFKEKLLDKLTNGKEVDKSKYDGKGLIKPIYCKRCLYPFLSASPMQIDKDGVCMGCKTADIKSKYKKEEYQRREKLLRKLCNSRNNLGGNKNYDCIVSVSGGKDSYYQTHYVTKVLGLKALLVTYNGNNYSKIGWENLQNMRHQFDTDHIIFSPSIKVLKKLNKLAFVVMGDMNWHNHVGIYTTAARIAIQQKIPLIFWGEHGYADLCGQFSMDDFPEANYRERLEHEARGFEWNFFVGLDGITSKDMIPWQYPSDDLILNNDLRQIFLGHYIPWESNDHLEFVIKNYNFKVSTELFERTYRVGSNLDDIHENGIHDYLKYVKFAYGRCTDHASKDIRANKMSREKGLELVKKMDPILSKDIYRWLDYVQMSMEEFIRIADYFRDPRVWKYKKGEWIPPIRN